MLKDIKYIFRYLGHRLYIVPDSNGYPFDFLKSESNRVPFMKDVYPKAQWESNYYDDWDHKLIDTIHMFLSHVKRR